jgi:hypothetical protein
MYMLAERSDVVIGIDTHKHTHTAAAVAATGAVLEHLTVPADPKGYRRVLAFGRRHEATRWAIEGTGSFGAGLTTLLLASGERVVEVEPPQRTPRRAGVKSDDIDAVRAARQALAGVGVSEPRRRGEHEAIRVLLTTRSQAIEFRTRAITAAHAIVVSAPDSLRERLRSMPPMELLHTCAGLRGSSRQSSEEFATQALPQALRRPPPLPPARGHAAHHSTGHRSVPLPTVAGDDIVCEPSPTNSLRDRAVQHDARAANARRGSGDHWRTSANNVCRSTSVRNRRRTTAKGDDRGMLAGCVYSCRRLVSASSLCA